MTMPMTSAEDARMLAARTMKIPRRTRQGAMILNFLEILPGPPRADIYSRPALTATRNFVSPEDIRGE